MVTTAAQVRRSRRPANGLAVSPARLLVGVVVLGVLVPFALMVDVPLAPGGDVWRFAVLILVYAGVRLAWNLATPTAQYADFFFWLFVYTFMGLAPAVQLRSGAMGRVVEGVDSTTFGYSLIVVVAGIGAYEAGRGVSRSVRSRAGSAPRMVAIGRLRALTAISVVLALFVVVKVGPRSFLLTREAFDRTVAGVWPDLSTAAIVMSTTLTTLLVSSHGWLGLARSGSAGVSTRRTIGVATGLVAMAIANPVSAARQTFGTVWGSYVIGARASRSARGAFLVKWLLIAGLLFVFPIADRFRRVGLDSGSRTGFFDEYLGGDYDAFGMLTNAVSYVQVYGIVWGHQALGSVFFFVPRAVWPGKPEDTGVLLSHFRGYQFTNRSSPLWAEAYVNFGMVGVVVVFAALAYLLRRLDSATTQEVPAAVANIAGAVLPPYLLILLRGSLLQATGFAVVFTVALWAVSRRSETAPGTRRAQAGRSAVRRGTAAQ